MVLRICAGYGLATHDSAVCMPESEYIFKKKRAGERGDRMRVAASASEW